MNAERQRLRLHAVEPASLANGPGLRAVVWFQGCTLGCPGCFNPQTHDGLAGSEIDTADLAAQILCNSHGVEGVTFSGGEPFQQPEALLDVLQRIEDSPLGVVCFSGYTIAEIRRQPLGPTILGYIDALIAGRYVRSKHYGRAMLGSSNQRVHLLTNRYQAADFHGIAPGEINLHADGTVTLSGLRSLRSSLLARANPKALRDGLSG